MNTAVCLRNEGSRVTGYLVHPENVLAVDRGKLSVALVEPGRTVAYVAVHDGKKRRVFVFRTLGPEETAVGAIVPGVYPTVRLLVSARSAGRIRLVEALFRYLAEMRRNPSELSDAFYLRVSHVLGGRLTSKKILPSLLAQEPG